MVTDRPISSYISVFGSLIGCAECTSLHRDTVNVLRFLNFRPQGLDSPLGTSDTSIAGTLDVERFCSSENRVRTLRMYSGVGNIGITQNALSLYHSIGEFPVENAAIGNEGRSRRRRRLSLSEIGVAVALNTRSGSEAGKEKELQGQIPNVQDTSSLHQSQTPFAPRRAGYMISMRCPLGNDL